MTKTILLVLITLLPVLLALFGYSGASDNPPENIGLVRALTLSPWVAALIGGTVALILRHRRAIWWSMVVVFVYSYLTLGLTWGGFWSEGFFGTSMFSASSTFAAIAFIGAVFTHGMLTVVRKAFALLDQPQQQPPKQQRKPRR